MFRRWCTGCSSASSSRGCLYIAAKQAGGNPVSAALTYVQEHFSEPITVNDMAEQVNLSPSSFSHLFREVTGRSPYQFLKELRLDRARELLLDGRARA